jgi:PAS domain S-box-containing protein
MGVAILISEPLSLSMMNMKGQSILVVDDEEQVLSLLGKTFAGSPYRVLTARDGQTALRLLESQPISLVLSDDHLPGMRGVELLKEVRRRRPDCVRMLFTGRADLEAVVAAVNEGEVHRFFTKPWNAEALLRAVDEMIERSELRRENQRLTELTARQSEQLLKLNAELERRLEEHTAQLQRRDQELAALRDKYLDLYHHAPDGYYSFTPEGTIVEINETQLKRLGYTREEVVGKMRARDFLTASGVVAFSDFMAELAEKGEVSAEFEMVKKDKTTIHTRISARAIYTDAGELALGHVSAREITAEKQLLAQLIQAQKVDSVGRLAGGIAHDFNNLLTGILGFTSLARRQLGPEHPANQSLAEVEQAARRAATLVQQLLAYSRQQINRPELLNLNQQIEEIAKFLTRILPETIKLKLHLGQQVDNVKVDPTQLQQVVVNLCVNARDAMNNVGEIVIETGNAVFDEHFVQTHLGARAGAYAYFSVADTGVGMEPEILNRIFEPFFTTKAVGKGTGLGLSMVYGIVKSHEGYVTAESEPGKGSIFRVYFPAYQGEVRKRNSKAFPVRGGSETILVVDDEPTILSLAEQALSSYGYKVLTAASGGEALETCRRYCDEIALVISDVVMPDVSGTELHQALRNLRPAVRLLLSSGYSVSQDLKKYLAQGVPFIQKPYQIEELVRMVRKVLDS